MLSRSSTWKCALGKKMSPLGISTRRNSQTLWKEHSYNLRHTGLSQRGEQSKDELNLGNRQGNVPLWGNITKVSNHLEMTWINGPSLGDRAWIFMARSWAGNIWKPDQCGMKSNAPEVWSNGWRGWGRVTKTRVADAVQTTGVRISLKPARFLASQSRGYQFSKANRGSWSLRHLLRAKITEKCEISPVKGIIWVTTILKSCSELAQNRTLKGEISMISRKKKIAKQGFHGQWNVSQQKQHTNM